jgi:hypothetical protein
MVFFHFSFVHSSRGTVIFLVLQGGKGAMSFFLKENFTLERGERAWVYLINIFFVNFIIIYILLSNFLTPKWGAWHGFYFSPFFNFLYCVLSFCYHFLLLPGEGGVVFLTF